MAASDYISLVQQFYVGFYGRPADVEGLAFWSEQVDQAGGDFSVVLAAFANSEEAQAFVFEGSDGEAYTTAQLVENVYQNLFGRAADAEGLAFYTAALDEGTMTLDSIVKNVVDGAEEGTSDKAAIDNKVVVATYFTDNLGDASYGADDILAVRAVIAAVDSTPESVTSAEAATDSWIADQPAAADAALIAALDDVAAAKGDVAAFLAAADGDDDPDTSAAEGDIATAQASALTAVDALVQGDYTGASTAVRAALLSDQQSALDDALGDAEDDLADATADVANVAGLTEAVAAYNSAVDASDAADATAAAAATAEAAEDAAVTVIIEAENTDYGLSIVTGVATLTITDAGGVDTNLFSDGDTLALTVVDGTTGLAALADPADDLGLTDPDQIAEVEALQALLADYVAAFNARVAADDAASEAATSENAALSAVNYLDVDAATIAAREAVGAAMTQVTPVNADEPSQAEIATEIATLEALRDTLEDDLNAVTYDTDDATTLAIFTAILDAAEAAGVISAADNATILAAIDGVAMSDQTTTDAAATAGVTELITNANNSVDRAGDGFQALVDAYDAAAATNDLLDAKTTAESAVTAAQDDIDALADALSVLADADADVTELADLKAAVTDAETVITDMGYQGPVTVVSGANSATAYTDIFLSDETVPTSSITNFGLLGDDMLYIGDEFTYNAGDITTDGDNSVLEFFLTESGANTIVSLEQVEFGSSAATPEVAEITLTGVAIEDVNVVDGFITVA